MNLLKKSQKRPLKKNKININNNLSKSCCGTFYIKTLENGNITANQLEAVRRVLTKSLKKTSKIWIRIKPNCGLTAKVGDKRMGKGKGDVILNIFKASAGSILFEVEGLNSKLIYSLLMVAKKKLPVKTKVVIKLSL